jgi:hypothetical protein
VDGEASRLSGKADEFITVGGVRRSAGRGRDRGGPFRIGLAGRGKAPSSYLAGAKVTWGNGSGSI